MIFGTVHSNSSSSFSNQSKIGSRINRNPWGDQIFLLEIVRLVQLVGGDWCQVREGVGGSEHIVCTQSIVTVELLLEEIDSAGAIAEGNGGVVEPRLVDVLEDICDLTSILRVHGQEAIEQREKFGGEALPHSRGLDCDSVLPLYEFEVVRV